MIIAAGWKFEGLVLRYSEGSHTGASTVCHFQRMLEALQQVWKKTRVYYYIASPSPHPPSLTLLATSCKATSYQRPSLATLSTAYPTYYLTLTPIVQLPIGFLHSTYHMQSFSWWFIWLLLYFQIVHWFHRTKNADLLVHNYIYILIGF